MDGTGVTSFSAGGGGTVYLREEGTDPWEQFEIVEHPDGTVNIASVAFSNVFLRMDGRGVTSFSDGGGGTVNCQYTAGPWETFTINTLQSLPEGDRVVNIESVAFPNVYLRLGEDPGPVNCQYTAGYWEEIFLQLVPTQPSGTVPDVINLSPSAASAKIQAAGFTYCGSADPVEGNFKPYAEDQNPEGGTTAALGSTVNVTIAVPVKGPPP